MCLYLLSISKLMDLLLTGLITGRLANSLTECSAFAKAKSESFCQIKLRSLQSIRLSISTDDGCAFGPRKASKVEKPSSRGVSYLHRWSLMLLPVLWLMPLCALCTHVCVSTLVSESTQLCVVATLLLLPGAGTHDSDLSALLLLHLDYINERANIIGDLTRHRVF